MQQRVRRMADKKRKKASPSPVSFVPSADSSSISTFSQSQAASSITPTYERENLCKRVTYFQGIPQNYRARSRAPSVSPSAEPSGFPSAAPSTSPSAGPSGNPSSTFSAAPSASPSVLPSTSPSSSPSSLPTVAPSSSPRIEPTSLPSSPLSSRPSSPRLRRQLVDRLDPRPAHSLVL
jgi:hypothetical protein